mgnify:CR=1 FL=1
MTAICDVCGKPVMGLSWRRRLALQLRDRLERLAFWLDVVTAPRYMGPLHLHDEAAWEAFERALHDSEPLR